MEALQASILQRDSLCLGEGDYSYFRTYFVVILTIFVELCKFYLDCHVERLCYCLL